MQESLTDYAAALAGSDLDTLDELISKKYRKFLRFFGLIREYTKDVKKVKYEITSQDELRILITFTKNVSLDEKKDLIKEMENAGYKVTSEIDGKKMKLRILYKED